MPEPPAERPRGAVPIALAATVVGLLWRLWLAPRYFGHEEEDWGNLRLARGVAESGFAWFELEHMPGYAWMVAALTLLGVEIEAAAVGAAAVCGSLAVGVTALLGARWFGPAVGIAVGLLMAFQPEASLYSATPLREGPYLLLSMTGIFLAGERRWTGAGLALALAFLVRFNASFSLLPALLLATLWLRFRGDPDWRGALRAAAILLSSTLAWALVYRLHEDGGTFAFWGGVMDRNTGGAVADLSRREHLEAVLRAGFGLGLRVLPAHLGPAVLLCAPVGVAVGLRALGSGDAGARAGWLALCTLGTVGLLFVTAALSTYEWFHNLYWKWLTPSVPLLLLTSVLGARALAARLGRLGPVFLGVAALSTALAFGLQTRNQLEASERLLGPQVRTARWIEEAFIEDIAVLGDGIPLWYLDRRPSDRVTILWSDPAVPSDDPEALGRFLYEGRVAVVFWFAEDWMGAADKAPFLAGGEAVELGPVTLSPVAWAGGYGMIAYAVQGAYQVPAPTRQPPPGTWFPPPEHP